MAGLLLPMIRLIGCAGQWKTSRTTVLSPPKGAQPAVAAQFEKCNALYALHDCLGATLALREAISADPGLAGAYYNLPIAPDRQGRQAEAKKHDIEAADLAPDNKIIWDSQPLRTQTVGCNYGIHKPSFQDATPRPF